MLSRARGCYPSSAEWVRPLVSEGRRGSLPSFVDPRVSQRAPVCQAVSVGRSVGRTFSSAFGGGAALLMRRLGRVAHLGGLELAPLLRALRGSTGHGHLVARRFLALRFRPPRRLQPVPPRKPVARKGAVASIGSTTPQSREVRVQACRNRRSSDPSGAPQQAEQTAGVVASRRPPSHSGLGVVAADLLPTVAAVWSADGGVRCWKAAESVWEEQAWLASAPATSGKQKHE